MHRQGRGRQYALGHLNADLAPFIDDPGRIELVRLVDIAVQELEGQTFGAGFFNNRLASARDFSISGQ
jgi:hypothetical protein